MTKNAEHYKDIAIKLRRDDPEDAEIIEWLEEKKKEGISVPELFRYLARKEKRKEERYENPND